MKVLPATGTAAFLEKISPHIPDDLIDSLFAHRCSRGRPQRFSPSQLFRVSLLPLLTPARSYNLIASLLGEQRPLRSFARLRNRMAIPDVRMLHEFRERMDLTKLRCLNMSLLRPLLHGCDNFAKTVALIDSTDLPAATNGYKKIPWANTSPAEPTSVRAAVKMVRADTTSDTRSTPCDFGFASILLRFCWPPWFRGQRLPIGTIQYFWNLAFTIAHASWSGLRIL
jgi:hypothetical protein